MTSQTHTYEPRGACRELFDIRAPEVLIAGPAGTGKPVVEQVAAPEAVPV